MSKPASEAADKILAIIKEYDLAAIVILEQKPAPLGTGENYTGETLVAITPTWSCLFRQKDQELQARQDVDLETIFATSNFLFQMLQALDEEIGTIEQVGQIMAEAYPPITEAAKKAYLAQFGGIDPTNTGRN